LKGRSTGGVGRSGFALGRAHVGATAWCRWAPGEEYNACFSSMSTFACVPAPASNQRRSEEFVAGSRHRGMVRSRRAPAQKNPPCSSLPWLCSPSAPPTQLSPLAQFRARVASPLPVPPFSSPELMAKERGSTWNKWAVRGRISKNRVTWGTTGQCGAVRWRWAQYRAAAQRNSEHFSSETDAEQLPTCTNRRAILQVITCTHNRR